MMRAATVPDAAPDAAPAAAPDWGPASTATEPDVPCPPRYWWLRRLTVAGVALGLALSGLRVYWGREASRRLQAELAPIIALGQPVSASALNAAPVPDRENGAPLYLKAMAVFGTDSPAASSMEYPDHPPFPPRWHKMEDKSVATNGEVFRLVREARRFHRFDWGVRVLTPSRGVAIPYLNKVRHLANILGDAALHAHVHGDDAEALERIRDVLHAAGAVDAEPNLLVSHLVATGVRAVAIQRLEVITAELTIGPGEDASPARAAATTRPVARPATRAQVRALIAELLDEREQLRELRGAYVTERAAQLDIARWNGANAALLRPMFDLDSVHLVRAHAGLIRAAGQPNFKAVKEALASEPMLQQTPQLALNPAGRGTAPARILAMKRPPIDYTRFFTTDFATGSLWRSIEQDLRIRLERRFAAVALAVRLYRADHGGQFPPSLEALVPAYLPRVPVDPFGADERPLKFAVARGALPGGRDRPIVYSVGIDGLDRTAEVGLAKSGLPNAPQYGFWNSVDQWRDLTRWEPPKTAADEAEDARQEKLAEPILNSLDKY